MLLYSLLPLTGYDLPLEQIKQFRQLSASSHITFTEDRAQRFEAYGWHTQTVENGNDLEAIDRALRAAQAERERPSLILVRTHIGYGSPPKQDCVSSDRRSGTSARPAGSTFEWGIPAG
jgi:transketolase